MPHRNGLIVARAQTLRRAAEGAAEVTPETAEAVTGGAAEAEVAVEDVAPESAEAEQDDDHVEESVPAEQETSTVEQEAPARRRVALADGQWLLHKCNHLGPGTEFDAGEFDAETLAVLVQSGALVEL